MAFSTVYKVMQPPLQYLAPKHFYHSKVKPVPIKQLFPTPPCMISWQLPIWLLLLWISLFLIVHIHGITLYVTFCVWHLSRSVMFKGSSMLLDVSVLHSFLCLHNIPWHGYAAICLYIHLFIDVWVVSIALAKSLFPYMILWKNLTIFLANPLPFDQYEYRCTCTCLSTVFKMVLYLTVDLLGQMVILCLTFSGTVE